MDRQDAIAEIKRRVPITRYLQKSKSGLYCCPFCGSGTGQHKTGAFKVYEDNTGYCQACGNEEIDGRPADAIDLERKKTGADFNTALSTLAAELGIDIDKTTPAAGGTGAGTARTETRVENPNKEGKALKTQNTGSEGVSANYSDYYRACYNRITDPAAVAYLESRGIGLDVAVAFNLGFDPAADPANAPGGVQIQGKTGHHPTPRIIIPVTPGHYVTRAINKDIDPAFAKMNNYGSTPGIFNEAALYDAAPAVFVCEGVFNALSFLAVNAPAIALNSASNTEKLLKMIDEKRPAAPLVLCMDQDGPGRKAEKALADELRKRKIAFSCADITGGYGDNNDYLIADRAGFTAAVDRAKRKLTRPDNIGDYMAGEMAVEMENLQRDTDRKTGFSNLDNIIKSLYSGLYVIGGISSVGKTTFTAQLADQLAAAGQDVLFFSLEQSRLEMVSKSISRETAKLGTPKRATNSLQIRLGASGNLINEAREKYAAAVGQHLSIIEGNMECTAEYIEAYTRGYIKATGARPVVFVDYLQVLGAMQGQSAADLKRIVDLNIVALKRISRDCEIPVIVVSSVNRANYLTPIDFESFKESGAIEFTADVVWGLQLAAIHDPIFKENNKLTEKREAVKTAKNADPRKIELSCLKNRYGVSSYDCEFIYYPHCDYFVPAPADSEADGAASGPAGADEWKQAAGGTPFDAESPEKKKRL